MPQFDGPEPAGPDGEFRSDLKHLLNRHSRENGSNTPDFMLADFLVGVLAVFDAAVVERAKWYGRGVSIDE